MIKINLLPQKRARGRASSPSDPSAKQIWVGVAGLAAAAAVVWFTLDRPKRAKLAELEAANAQLAADIKLKNDQLKGYAQLKKAADAADERYRSIKRLLSAKVVPANVLHELGEVLTASKNPTMTSEMIKRTSAGPDADPNKQFEGTWDASHVWLSGFSDTGGTFRLEGGAQSESDITQLAKRLAASVYFADVTPAGAERVADNTTGTNYYKFTITGRLAY
jgi:Tfp pilus assembly protein PilN